MPDAELIAAQREFDAARDRLRRAKMGQPLPLSDAETDGMGDVQPSDMAGARALWRPANPGLLGSLLDADVMGDE